MVELLKKLVEEHFNTFPVLAVVLYTEEHPYISKALRDPDLWTALNKISGVHIGVIATSLPAGTWESNRVEQPGRPTMIRIWREPSANEELLTCFGLKNSRKLPLITFLTMLDGTVCLKNVPISGESVESAFASLGDILSTAVLTLQKHGIGDGDHRRAFELVCKSLTLRKAKRKAADILSVLISLRGLLGV